MAASYLEPVSRRRRAVAIGLTILVHLLIVWALLNLGPRLPSVPTFGDALSTFNVAPESKRDTSRQAARAAPRQPQPVRPVRPPTQPPPPIEIKRPSNVIWMSRDQFAATDLSKLPQSAAGDEGTATADTGGDSKAAYGPGEGPGGQRLYNAEWAREPTSAELRTFLPQVFGWGLVACRTIPDNRVENCQILGEEPRGSGLATGVRRAAWQFHVRPPRVGGKPQIGAWVKILIEYSEAGARAGRR